MNGQTTAAGITSTVLNSIQDADGNKFPKQSANTNRVNTDVTVKDLSWASETLTSSNGQVYDFVTGQQYVSILKIAEYLSQS